MVGEMSSARRVLPMAKTTIKIDVRSPETQALLTRYSAAGSMRQLKRDLDRGLFPNIFLLGKSLKEVLSTLSPRDSEPNDVYDERCLAHLGMIFGEDRAFAEFFVKGFHQGGFVVTFLNALMELSAARDVGMTFVPNKEEADKWAYCYLTLDKNQDGSYELKNSTYISTVNVAPVEGESRKLESEHVASDPIVALSATVTIRHDSGAGFELHCDKAKCEIFEGPHADEVSDLFKKVFQVDDFSQPVKLERPVKQEAADKQPIKLEAPGFWSRIGDRMKAGAEEIYQWMKDNPAKALLVLILAMVFLPVTALVGFYAFTKMAYEEHVGASWKMPSEPPPYSETLMKAFESLPDEAQVPLPPSPLTRVAAPAVSLESSQPPPSPLASSSGSTSSSRIESEDQSPRSTSLARDGGEGSPPRAPTPTPGRGGSK